ncbi:Uncharacterized protein BM_BM13464 [Brugia malayi]|uniref:Bm13464 n=1 Tax=Brugia malayi TaxID=6279 RepID=A0A0K0IXX1_BRUMA|nr:Uncharacterized protein BM_BM13464 [Brugia malayi]CDP96109.1 Bm13464 [Brugia malayi]VIO98606.1 Uncharacterized protein BM_BM13464 [Brugia malayi]
MRKAGIQQNFKNDSVNASLCTLVVHDFHISLHIEDLNKYMMESI